MAKPTWEIFIGVLCAFIVFVVPTVLYLMEKAGINITWIFVVGWLSIALACLYLVLNIPWIWASGNIGIRAWRVCFVSAIALLAAGYGATRIWPSSPKSPEVQLPEGTHAIPAEPNNQVLRNSGN